MKRIILALLCTVTVTFLLGCQSKRNVTRIDPIRSQYTAKRMHETMREDVHMAREDLIMFFALDEPSRLSPEQGFRY